MAWSTGNTSGFDSATSIVLPSGMPEGHKRFNVPRTIYEIFRRDPEKGPKRELDQTVMLYLAYIRLPYASKKTPSPIRNHGQEAGEGAATSPCFAKTAFSFSTSGGPPAFTMIAVSLKKSGPIRAGVTTASALASVSFRLLKP